MALTTDQGAMADQLDIDARAIRLVLAASWARLTPRLLYDGETLKDSDTVQSLGIDDEDIRAGLVFEIRCERGPQLWTSLTARDRRIGCERRLLCTHFFQGFVKPMRRVSTVSSE